MILTTNIKANSIVWGKMHNDLRIAKALSLELLKNGLLLILDSGYACDISAHSEISRFHNDFDAIIAGNIKNELIKATLIKVIESVLKRKVYDLPTKNNWIWLQTTKDIIKDEVTETCLNQNNLDFIEYRFNFHLIESSLDCVNDHYLELISGKNIQYHMPISKINYVNKQDPALSQSFLIASKENLAATKIRLIKSYAPDFKIRDKDVYDIKNLLSSKSFDNYRFIKELISVVTLTSSKSDALAYIEDTIDNLVKRYPDMISEEVKLKIKSILRTY